MGTSHSQLNDPPDPLEDEKGKHEVRRVLVGSAREVKVGFKQAPAMSWANCIQIHAIPNAYLIPHLVMVD